VPDARRAVAAVDLGAASGRVVLGRLGDAGVELELVHRFDNRPVWLPDGLHWDLQSIFVSVLHGLASAAENAGGRLDSIGVDAWGCDYALLDEGGRMLGLPYHYRDPRTTDQVLDEVHEAVPASELYRRTGIQTMPINTVFQLASERGRAALERAARIALIPDLIGQWLTGVAVNELTAASTTGLLDARHGTWANDLAARIGLPAAPFAGELTAPGCRTGEVLSAHAAAGGATGTPLHTVGGHDTASAFVAAPVTGPRCAVLSSGTWSLLGVEVDEPCLTDDAARFNFTNERGVAGNIRLLRNVMGLWLVQECQRAWAAGTGRPSFQELHELALAEESAVPLFDPDDPVLLRTGQLDMPARIQALCGLTGSKDDGRPSVLVRAILTSLACKYRLVLERLEIVTGRSIDEIVIVGGGVENRLLCQLTADITGREVLAGPRESTALGNVLVQALALGEADDVRALRELGRRSTSLSHYEPASSAHAEETYRRFIDVTGLTAGSRTRTSV
jgi:rhamnulokinase